MEGGLERLLLRSFSLSEVVEVGGHDREYRRSIGEPTVGGFGVFA